MPDVCPVNEHWIALHALGLVCLLLDLHKLPLWSSPVSLLQLTLTHHAHGCETYKNCICDLNSRLGVQEASQVVPAELRQFAAVSGGGGVGQALLACTMHACLV